MEDAAQQLLQVLSEIRENQKHQLARQEEALALQREHFAVLQRQVERAEKIQDRAERLQDRSAQLVGVARKIQIVAIPLLLAILLYVSWLLFRHVW